VGFYPANGFGLFDMIGNVWEWTADWFSVAQAGMISSPCCAPRNPRGGDEAGSRDPADVTHRFGRKVLKGGSHLCADNYCHRYRPAARHAQSVDSSTSHIGFRCARDA
jgi:formylglycine-generating enzyme required for sulfatase activity